MAQPSTHRVSKKRMRARESGLCITCCRRAPANDRAVCEPCIQAARLRTTLRRQRLRRAQEALNHIASSEIAGDTAASRHYYEDAVQLYEDALNTPGASAADYARLSEKLGYALFFGGNPHSAETWFERALSNYISDAATAAKAVGILLRMARQLWLDSKTHAALPIISQAISIARSSGDTPAFRRANIVMAQYLVLLSRYNDAAAYCSAVEPLSESDDAELRTIYWNNRAIQAAAVGNVDESHALFESATRSAAAQADPYLVTLVLDDRALWSSALGALADAKRFRDEALMLARQHHIAWRVPYLCLRSAAHLHNMGLFSAAWDHLLNALSYENPTPAQLPLLASVGIPLALHFDDDATLARVALPESLDFAFQSGEQSRIAMTAAAFAQLAYVRGHIREARSLLHRGLAHVHHADQCWDLFVATARYGNLDDAATVRSLLKARTRLPCPDVAEAHRSLCEAFWAQRTGAAPQALTLAADARRRFDALGWRRWSETASELIRNASTTSQRATNIADLSGLTRRQHEVALLVAKGYSNRAVGTTLNISEHTVESHMSSIMSRLELHSRWQLIDLIMESGM